MTWHPVFIDGPLKGRSDIPIREHGRSNGYLHLMPPEGSDHGTISYATVHYRFTHVVLFDRELLVGHVADQPDGDAAFDLLCSDLAKATSRPLPVFLRRDYLEPS